MRQELNTEEVAKRWVRHFISVRDESTFEQLEASVANGVVKDDERRIERIKLTRNRMEAEGKRLLDEMIALLRENGGTDEQLAKAVSEMDVSLQLLAVEWREERERRERGY